MRAVNHERLRGMIRVAYDKRIPLFVWGTMGIGKSTAIRNMAIDLAKDLKLNFSEKDIQDGKFGFVDVRVSQLEPSDLRGLPSMSDGTTKWLPPSWLPSNPDSKGILFFDELNLALPSIQASAYQLILDRKLGDYNLPDGWVIISAGNRIEDKARVFELPSPLANRFIHIELAIPDKDEWYVWGSKNKIDGRILAFVQFKPSMLFNFNPSNKDKSFATPRSWYFCSKIIEGVEDEDMLLELVSSAVGEGTALEFLAFTRLKKQIDIKNILNNPKEVAKIKELDMKYTIISAIIEEYRKDKKLIEKIAVLCDYLEAEFGILILRFLKMEDNDYFKKNIVKASNWKKLSDKYVTFLKD